MRAADAGPLIRRATPEDGDAIRQIERLAAEQFREVGLDSVADDEPDSIESLTDYADAGRSWVAVDPAGEPVGYVVVDVVDRCAHVEQVSVHPDHQGDGVGGALLAHVGAWAISTGLEGITLTTFAEVPWNRPLFEQLGFQILDEDDIGPGLRAVREAEAAHGLDPATRVCMRLPVPHADRSR